MKLRTILPLLLFAAIAAVPAQAKASDHAAFASVTAATIQPSAVQASYTTHATPDAPSQLPLAPLSLLGFAFAGATTAATRKMTLSRSYLFNGVTYGPGRNIEVPEDFPDLNDDGSVVHEEGSRAAQNAARARQGIAPAGTPIDNPAGTVSGKTLEELGRMSKPDLVALAEEKGVEVTREDGGDGEPLVSDYVTALSEPEESPAAE